MKRTAALVLLTLAACDDIPQARTESEIRNLAEDVADDVAADYSSELSGRIDELEAKVADMENELNRQGRYSAAISNDLTSTQRVVSTNARIENEEAVRRMTERGACGTRLVQPSPGVWVNERIPCTLDDLRK